ncbi:MAG: XdhC family protein [Oceanidesulfovibrio sp.]
MQAPELTYSCLEGSYIVIVTRGHSHDGLVLRQTLHTQASYIGMIGSRSKREAVYQTMRQEGFTDADLARVHSPIGLGIGPQTPGEIAVSIVAELVQHRRQGG